MLSDLDAVDSPYGDDEKLSYPYCPCAGAGFRDRWTRWLNDSTEEDSEDSKSWEIAYTAIVLFFMFGALISDRMGADSVLLTALMFFMAAQIISVKEALEGFANEGLWTVMVLFVVAEGISKTGALDWYMSKLLGSPRTLAGAQLKLMAPIALISAFLNNTPVVVVMIPIVQKWAKHIRQSPQQLLIPLSFASILGGTCTLIGTSTNLVVVGLLDDRYGNDPNLNVDIGLFDLGQYGVPIALAGIAYVLMASPFLLPGGTAPDAQDASQVLLGARLTPWSPAVNRTVQRSGLRDTGGIYLVSVHRAATGNVHRAVSNDFVLNVGDILYFTTGNHVETFGEFCAEHGLEVVTNEIQTQSPLQQQQQQQQQDIAVQRNASHDSSEHNAEEPCVATTDTQSNLMATLDSHGARVLSTIYPTASEEDRPLLLLSPPPPAATAHLEPIQEDDAEGSSAMNPGAGLGCTKESLLQADEDELYRTINRMTDLIRNAHATTTVQRSILATDMPKATKTASGVVKIPSPVSKKRLPNQPQRQVSMTVDGLRGSDPPKIVVTIDRDLVVVGINTRDRPGLLLDISKCLLRLNLQLHHTEAAVVVDRSVSIWRCQVLSSTELPDLEEIWSVLSALLSADVGVEAMKKRGLRVIRARVIAGSRLVGKTPEQVNFRQVYKTAIVALRQAATGRDFTNHLSAIVLAVGDVLILQASDDSPILKQPPPNFYKLLEETLQLEHQQQQQMQSNSRSSSRQGLVQMISRRRPSQESLSSAVVATEERTSSLGTGSGMPVDPQTQDVASSSDDGEAIFFVGAEELEDTTLDDGRSSMAGTPGNAHVLSAAALFRQEQQERVWKDLMVLFRQEDGGGDGAAAPVREFLTAMAIAPGSNFAGKTVAQAGIDKLPELYLVSIERVKGTTVAATTSQNDSEDVNHDTLVAHKNIRGRMIRTMFSKLHHPSPQHDEREEGESIADDGSTRTEIVAFEAVDPEAPLREGDVLWFSGSASAVGDLRKIPGLVQYQSEQVEQIKDRIHDRRLVQAVIARNGPLIGKTVKEIRFRTRYGAAVIAVHREGRRVHEHPGNVKLQAGDVLLLEAGPSFIAKSAQNDRAFALLAEVKNSAPPRLELLIPALLIAVAMLVVYTAGVTELITSALVASVLMVLLGILSEQEARDALKWDIYLTIASAFGIGTALVNSGVAGGIANFMVDIGEAIGMGSAGLLGAVYFATFLISNVVTNNAAAALLFPIAMDAAEQTGTDLVIMSYCLMLGASASFMSPFGYTTNLLIYGPGGYKYNDFLWFGTPMQIVLWVLSTAFLVLEEKWYIAWVATSLFLIGVSIFRMAPRRGRGTKPKSDESLSSHETEVAAGGTV